jgi:Rrf2 family protein
MPHSLLWGYLLAKSPEDIKVSEIIRLLEGSIAPVDCVDNPKLCTRSGLCVTWDIWDEVKKAVDGVLEGTTLQSMVERQERKNSLKQEMYYI